MSKICSLCLKEITEDQESVVVDELIRHKLCSEEFECDLKELEEIYNETCQDDI